MTREAFRSSAVYSSSEETKFYEEKDISKVAEEGFSSLISSWDHQFEQFSMRENSLTSAKKTFERLHLGVLEK